jgi:hypothetical protein
MDAVGGSCSNLHGNMRSAYEVFGNLKGTDQLGDLGIDEKMILNGPYSNKA